MRLKQIAVIKPSIIKKKIAIIALSLVTSFLSAIIHAQESVVNANYPLSMVYVIKTVEEFQFVVINARQSALKNALFANKNAKIYAHTVQNASKTAVNLVICAQSNARIAASIVNALRNAMNLVTRSYAMNLVKNFISASTHAQVYVVISAPKYVECASQSMKLSKHSQGMKKMRMLGMLKQIVVISLKWLIWTSGSIKVKKARKFKLQLNSKNAQSVSNTSRKL